MLAKLACALALAAGAAEAQMFGGVPAASTKCPYEQYGARTATVEDACCPTPADCPDGLPATCGLACGATFVNFWKDCQAFTVSTMGAEAADNFHTFDANCRQQDVAELLEVIYSMTAQGCVSSAEGAEIAKLQHETTADSHTEGEDEAVGLRGAANHFAQELGICAWEDIQAKIDDVDQACCNERDRDDLCVDGVPTVCDLECAVNFVPFHEDCRSVLQTTMAEQMAMFDRLYGNCQAVTRKQNIELLRALYEIQVNFNDDVTCPIKGGIEFFADCPDYETECMATYIGADDKLSRQNIFQHYRFQVASNVNGAHQPNAGGSGLMCLAEVVLAGPELCHHDLAVQQTDAASCAVVVGTAEEEAEEATACELKGDASGCTKRAGKGSCDFTAAVTVGWTSGPVIYDADGAEVEHTRAYDEATYVLAHLSDSPANIMTGGGSGGDFCSNNAIKWPTSSYTDVVGPLRFDGIEYEQPFIQYSFSEPTEVTGYVIKSRNVNEAPRDFELQGSADGETWTTIETRTNTAWPAAAKRSKIFMVGAPQFTDAAPGIPEALFDAQMSAWTGMTDEVCGGH